MRIHGLALVAALSAAALTACSPSAPPSDGLPATQAPAGEAPAAATTAVAAAPAGTVAATLSVEPGVVHACEGRDRVAANVTWRVDDPSVTTVRVEVDSATDPKRNVFASGGATGEQKTDEWVVAGVRFHLIDIASNTELASYEVTSLPCE